MIILNAFQRTMTLLGLLLSLAWSHGDPFLNSVDDIEREGFAHWIAPASGEREGLFLYRKTFELDGLPETFIIHLSADPRYRLWVNGAWVTFGPAAGHTFHWNYETIDINRYLRPGANTIAVEVRQAGSGNGPRELSFDTAMILKGPDLSNGPLVSDASWKVKRHPGWAAIPMDREIAGGGYIAGATEAWTCAGDLQDWQLPTFDDSDWPHATEIGKGAHTGLNTWLHFTPWQLKPRLVPLMHDRWLDMPAPRRSMTGDLDGQGLPQWDLPLTVPAKSRWTLLFDLAVVDLGFPQLVLSGGAGAKLRLRYQEALFDEQGNKGNRNVIEGKTMLGIYDEIHLPISVENRVWEPFWLRTFRYLELTVETADEPLQLDAFRLRQIRYPFEVQGGFESDDSRLQPILEACWRTLELCALETYMDCSYYEQIQYIGDTRIQSLISLYLTGDARLMRNAILQFHESRQPNGLTRSAFPVSGTAPQIIPPFSLIYVGMIHDYFMLQQDDAFVRSLLPGVQYTLSWFLERLAPNGLLGPLPFWNHTDGGAVGFPAGSPPGSEQGGSVQISLMLAIALDQTAEMLDHLGDEEMAKRYAAVSSAIKASARDLAWDGTRQWFAETPDKQLFSQHTNALAMLAGLIDESEQSAFATRLVQDKQLVQGTLYFQFYVFEALQAAGRADLLLPELDRWTQMLGYGLSTFPEHGIESRSDVHAWAAHPLYHLLASTGGIRPATHGFGSVEIRPSPGALERLSARVVHPQGMITLQMDKNNTNGSWSAGVSLPEGVSGVLDWKGIQYPVAGDTELTLPGD